MNITFSNAVFCDQKGQQFKIDNFMVRFRQILYIQVPDSVGFKLKVLMHFLDRGKIRARLGVLKNVQPLVT